MALVGQLGNQQVLTRSLVCLRWCSYLLWLLKAALFAQAPVPLAHAPLPQLGNQQAYTIGCLYCLSPTNQPVLTHCHEPHGNLNIIVIQMCLSLLMQWQQVAAQLGTGRTPVQCLQHWVRSTRYKVGLTWIEE